MFKSQFADEDLKLLFTILNKITAVRDKMDLLHVIDSDLKKLIPYDDIVISRLVNEHTIKPLIHQFGAKRRENHMFIKLTSTSFDTTGHKYIRSVMESQEPSTVDLMDVGAKHKVLEPYLSFLLDTGISEQVAISLNDGRKVFGVVVLFMERRGTLTRKHFQLFQTITRHFSTAIENIIANDEIIRREQEKTILLDLNIDIAAVTNQGGLQGIISRRVRDLLGFDFMSIYILDEAGEFDLPWFYQMSNQGENEGTMRLDSSRDFICEKVFSSDKPIIFELDEIIQNPSIHNCFKTWHSAGVWEAIAAPMRIGGKNNGIFFLMNKQIGQFHKENLFLFQGIASQISIAISHLSVTEEIVKKDHQKSILLDLNYKFVSIRDRSGLSKVMADHLHKLFSFDYLSIGILDKPEESSYALFICQLTEKHADFPEIKSMNNSFSLPDVIYDTVFAADGPVIVDLDKIMHKDNIPKHIRFAYNKGAREIVGIVLDNGAEKNGFLIMFIKKAGCFNSQHFELLKGIVYQISMAVANIIANEKIGFHLAEINEYKKQLEREKKYLQEEIKTTYNYNEIIGGCTEMQKIFQLVSQVSYADSTVLLLGETGTGKELIARAIHNSSPRKNKVMMKVNCAAIPANLLESELFGHEKGSFTGADMQRIGKFELANNSTIFLDEIGELTLEFQAKLLRVLQEKEIERIGGKNIIKINIRVIAATNKNLLEETQEGRFRSDLFYRLNVFPIILPPLRNRKKDIPVLTSHFILKYARKSGKNIENISNAAMQAMLAYSWPGNVRELEHLIERSVLLTDDRIITDVHLPLLNQGGQTIEDDLQIKSIQQIEKDHIISVLKRCNGRVSGPNGAAKMLDLPASTLFSKMEKLGIKKNFGFSPD